LFALSINEAKDADELIQKDPNLWIETIKASKEIREYWLERGLSDFDLGSSLGKKQFVDRMIEIAELYATSYENNENIPFEVNLDQDIFLSRVTEAAQIDMAILKNELKKKYQDRAKGLEQKSDEKQSQGSESHQNIVRQAVIKSQGKPTARTRLEELYLSLVLLHPLVRASLDDLKAIHFSNKARQSIFALLSENKDKSKNQLVALSGDYEVYINQLLMIGENEFSGLTESRLDIQSFEWANKIKINANIEFKNVLIKEIQMAEAAGNMAAATELMKKYQAIIDAEA